VGGGVGAAVAGGGPRLARLCEDGVEAPTCRLFSTLRAAHGAGKEGDACGRGSEVWRRADVRRLARHCAQGLDLRRTLRRFSHCAQSTNQPLVPLCQWRRTSMTTVASFHRSHMPSSGRSQRARGGGVGCRRVREHPAVAVNLDCRVRAKRAGGLGLAESRVVAFWAMPRVEGDAAAASSQPARNQSGTAVICRRPPGAALRAKGFRPLAVSLPLDSIAPAGHGTLDQDRTGPGGPRADDGARLLGRPRAKTSAKRARQRARKTPPPRLTCSAAHAAGQRQEIRRRQPARSGARPSMSGKLRHHEQAAHRDHPHLHSAGDRPRSVTRGIGKIAEGFNQGFPPPRLNGSGAMAARPLGRPGIYKGNTVRSRNFDCASLPAVAKSRILSHLSDRKQMSGPRNDAFRTENRLVFHSGKSPSRAAGSNSDQNSELQLSLLHASDARLDMLSGSRIGGRIGLSDAQDVLNLFAFRPDLQRPQARAHLLNPPAGGTAAFPHVN